MVSLERAPMKITVNKLDGLKRVLDIEVPETKVKETFSQVYEQIKKEAKVPGFRPGTAPRNLLEKQFSKVAHEEVIKHLLPETYHEALEKEKLDVVSLPEVSEVNLTGSSLKYKATVELRPKIEVGNYSKIKIQKRSNEVTEEELNKAFDEVKKLRKVETLDDAFAHGLGYANLEELKGAFKSQLAIQKESANRAQLERDVINHLLKNSKFEVPQTLVERRIHEMQHEIKEQLEQSRMSKEDKEKKEKELEPKIKEQSEEQVKVFLILDEIAIREKIDRDDNMPNKVMEFLFKNADWTV